MSIAMIDERAATMEPDLHSPRPHIEAVLDTETDPPQTEIDVARERLSDAWRRLRELNSQRERYLVTLRSASPDSDMLEVAAAKAGLEILDRAMGEQRRVIALRGADVVRAEQGEVD